jgi:DNA-binding CsgD family transcriptional regulator
MPYSTDELMDLFKDWCRQVEDEIADFIAASGEVNTDKIAEKFHLSKESVVHLLRNIEKSPK